MTMLAPERMSRDAILAEVGELLAAGIQRFLAREIKSPAAPRNWTDPLDVLGDSEAPCVETTELPA